MMGLVDSSCTFDYTAIPGTVKSTDMTFSALVVDFINQIITKAKFLSKIKFLYVCPLQKLVANIHCDYNWTILNLHNEFLK
jgi:hypothetical protein